jgi:stalled ribosome alternative rescue factor ArfA
MNRYEHLTLPIFKTEIERKKQGRGGGYKKSENRQKGFFAKNTIKKADELISSFKRIQSRFAGKIDPGLIYEIQINQSVFVQGFEDLLTSMGIRVLSIAENKKGYWVVFSDDHNLSEFKRKLSYYGSETGPKYDFFNAIESIRDIPRDEKIGTSLKEKPLGDRPEFINIELWKIDTPEYDPETRLSRGDSYLGNRMEFHLFHSIHPQILVEKYGVLPENTPDDHVPAEIKNFEIKFFPGINIRKSGCHQKAWKIYTRQPKNLPTPPVTIALLNVDKWINDQSRMQQYCLSVMFEHEKAINLYNTIRTNIQTRVRM